MKDSYQTIAVPVQETLFKEKGSKFFGYAFPLMHEEEVKSLIDSLKKQHPTAGHFCYAYQLGATSIHYRVADDGEPKNSAGMPIYGQLQAFDLTNVLVVVVRYFGGTKLGVGGLIQAYKTSAQITLAAAAVVARTIDLIYELSFGYEEMNKVMRIIKEKNVKVLEQELGARCVYRIAVRKQAAEELYQRFVHLYKVTIKEMD
ncbi:MAG: IMPACT family protein [Flavobacteriaceae bacterium]